MASMLMSKAEFNETNNKKVILAQTHAGIPADDKKKEIRLNEADR